MFNTKFSIIENMLFDEILNTIKALSQSEIEDLIEKASDDKGEPLYRETYSGEPLEEQLAWYITIRNDDLDNPKVRKAFDGFDIAEATEKSKLDLQEMEATYDEYMQKAERAKQEYMKEYGVSENVIDYDER